MREVDVRAAEAFDYLLDQLLVLFPSANPWHAPDSYSPNYRLLERLLSVPVRQGAGQQSGRLARATDAWVAHELRGAGFGEHEVWPRARSPRVLPQPLVAVEDAVRRLFVDGKVPVPIRDAIRGWSQAYLLGQYYRKQVDVVISNWDRGAELIVSTKSMLSSYWNNLRNRFEEFIGDARNLRGRYPLAAIGILFVVRSTVFEETGAFDFLVDMLRRLRSADLYDTVGLVVVAWHEEVSATWRGRLQLDRLVSESPVVTLVIDHVPVDLGAERFLADLVDCVLSRTPVTFHVRCRELRLGRSVPVPEEGGGETPTP